ncbi:MAG TPA: phospho-sugar mutase [Clostridia bacterium]|nr:phospho-sugar mutase [Clostridia bacterium]
MSFNDFYNLFLSSNELTADEKARLHSLNDNEKREMFEIPLEFGTAGMRGVLDIGTNRMNTYTVKRATQGLADYMKTLGENAMKRGIVISYDTRKFSSEFACLCARVLSKCGIAVWLFENVRPVPVCSFAIRHLGAVGAIMITASHNPKQYNGYKVYGDDGAQMSPEATAKVVEFINLLPYFGIEEAETNVCKECIANKDNEKLDEYITVIGKSVDEAYYSTIQKLSLSPDAVKAVGGKIKIVYTPIHGSGYVPVTTILDRIGLKISIVPEQAQPDTEFSTVRMPNPEEPDALKMAIELADKIGSDLCIGTDPDCDRMGIAVRDLEGKFILLNGNQIGSLLCDYILSRNKMRGTLNKNAAIVKTIVTTELAREIADSYGVKTFEVLTGFKFIGEKIKEWEATGEHTYMFGYEESFGYLSGTHARDKDAVVASMLFAEMACYYNSIGLSIYQKLQELFQKFGYYVEKSVSLVYGGLDGMQTMKNIMIKIKGDKPEKIAGVKVAATANFDARIKTYANGETENIDLPKTNAVKYYLEGGDWICVRPSGTEPKLKIYVATKANCISAAEDICQNYIQAMKATLA